MRQAQCDCLRDPALDRTNHAARREFDEGAGRQVHVITVPAAGRPETLLSFSDAGCRRITAGWDLDLCWHGDSPNCLYGSTMMSDWPDDVVAESWATI